MAGKGNFSPSQTPQYGDKVALKRELGNTTTPMSGAPTPRPTAGRPPEGGAGQVQAPGVTSEQKGMMSEVAQAIKRLQYFQQVNAALDNSETRMYLADAQREFERASHEVKNGTPDWDGV